ncbi:hypothetical protein L1987_42359 [Smallanthus sonchifolius]|uniref:Uncharacterized protein n=1 Tax=Smallanthus sonchifolius TaxID=185202 RepID=A0ACB9GKL1_9ASTR|nr:hypothetical protein L1987_42359 [Smallanthus sonchifolius]
MKPPSPPPVTASTTRTHRRSDQENPDLLSTASTTTTAVWMAAFTDFDRNLVGHVRVSQSSFLFNKIVLGKKGLEKKAFDAYHMMIKYGVTPSFSTCNSLLMCLSRNGKLQEAEELM